MGYGTKILLDSISPAGRRLTTWELTYPRFVHAELMTHRLFSRNSASSRAIPNEKLRQRVKEDPALPLFWGANQKGMQAAEELPFANGAYPLAGDLAKQEWLRARDLMLEASEHLSKIGLHKQLCNRLIEPWMFITVIVSATSFDNWYHLRDHWQAQPEIAWVARDMHEKIALSTPRQMEVGSWHLPLVGSSVIDHEHGNCACNDVQDTKKMVDSFGLKTAEEAKEKIYEILKKVSVGRVARVSLLTHDGKRDLAEDVGLHDRLLEGTKTGNPLHMSPFEHIAQCLADPNEQSGNFRGWGQYRKAIKGEHFGEVLP